MKIKVFDETQVPETTVYLRLIDGGKNRVAVYAVDEAGDQLPRGCLLVFQEGRVIRSPHVSSALGFSLDEAGRLAVE